MQRKVRIAVSLNLLERELHPVGIHDRKTKHKREESIDLCSYANIGQEQGSPI